MDDITNCGTVKGWVVRKYYKKKKSVVELVTSNLVSAGGYLSWMLRAGRIQHLGQEIKSWMFCSFNNFLQLISPTTFFLKETLCLCCSLSVVFWTVVCRCCFCRIYLNLRGSYSLAKSEIIHVSGFYQHLTKYYWVPRKIRVKLL